MCYICNPHPTKKQRETDRTIRDAIRIWRKKLPALKDAKGDRSVVALRKSWGFTHDWSLKPRDRLW